MIYIVYFYLLPSWTFNSKFSLENLVGDKTCIKENWIVRYLQLLANLQHENLGTHHSSFHARLEIYTTCLNTHKLWSSLKFYDFKNKNKFLYGRNHFLKKIVTHFLLMIFTLLKKIILSLNIFKTLAKQHNVNRQNEKHGYSSVWLCLLKQSS